MTTQSEFMAAVQQLATERGIDPEEIFVAIEQAMLTIYKKYYGEGEAIYTELNRQTGDIRMIADKKVVDKVTDDKTQIALEVALELEPRLKKGDHVEVDVTPEEGFGRLAAQVARQVIMQKVREAERDVLINRFKEKEDTIQTGTIQRMSGRSVIIEIDRITVTMPPEEQIIGEFYRSGTRKKFYLKKSKGIAGNQQLVVSRACPEFLVGLFELEVPEISTGTVEIKSVAREAGSRSKVAVWSNQEGIDPIGSCVGQRGIRINAVTDELGGEKIDIILWDDNISNFIANSLSPAEVISVEIDKSSNSALVKVPEDQLSLAIGKEGQNVRLAAKLTGWKIDISGPKGDIIGTGTVEDGSDKSENNSEDVEIDEMKNISSKLSKRTLNLLKKNNISFENVSGMTKEELMTYDGIGEKASEEILDSLK